MPPSPRISLHIDPTKYAALCEDMGIAEEPEVYFRDRLPKGSKTTYGGSGSVFGVYSATQHRIGIFTEQKQYEYDRLRAVNAELVITLIHELRHAWQYKHADGASWSVVRRERDAEGFAQENYHKWRGVIQLRRQTFHKKLPG